MSATAFAIIFAMLAQGGIALVLMAVMGSIRLPMIGKGTVRIADMALSREPWPENEKRVSNAFDNQFQLPVLFYVAGFVALYLQPTLLEAVLAWAFVVSRIAHAAVFAINNHVLRRFWCFAIGYFILCALWLDLVIRLIALALGNP